MKVYLARKGYVYSTTTIHKYMNTELELRSIVRPKNPGFEHGKPHRVFTNKLNQNFTADEINRKWCTNLYDFETEEALYQKVEEFAYVDYNHVRPHSFNGYRTPYETRIAS